MPEAWAMEHLLAVVQDIVGSGPDEEQTPMQVLLDGADILVTFRWRDDPQLYGVRFPTTQTHEGPMTGEDCETEEEWAQEVALLLMEELDTGLVARGRRVGGPNGVVELDYHNNHPGYEETRQSLPPLPDGHFYRAQVAPPETE